jgi:hypothetical protein
MMADLSLEKIPKQRRRRRCMARRFLDVAVAKVGVDRTRVMVIVRELDGRQREGSEVHMVRGA